MKNDMEKMLSSQQFRALPDDASAFDKAAALRDRKKTDVNLFQGYDIRGDAIAVKPGARVNLKPANAYLIGLSIGSDFVEKASAKKGSLYRPKVFAAADNRLSSPSLREALTEGFCDAGCLVDFTEEEVPTGAVSRRILIADYDISVQITGSHNPYFNNGFKITTKQNANGQHDPDGIPSALYGNKRARPFELIDIYDRIVSDSGLRLTSGGQKRKLTGIVEEYIDSFIAHFRKKLRASKGKLRRPFLAVIDPGNGVGSCAERLFEALGVKTISIFTKSDGSFPNHPADPSKEDGVKFTCEFVRGLNAKSRQPYIGIVFDGDGDRSGIINEDGDVIYPEKIVVVNYIRFILENMKALQAIGRLGDHVSLALDVRGSSFMEETIAAFAAKKKLGLRGEYIPAGYPSHRTFVRAQIRKIDSLLVHKKISSQDKSLLEELKKSYTSAETSGHFFYATAPDSYPDIVIDDGIFAAANLLYIVDTLGQHEAREPLLGLKKKASYQVKDLFEVFRWKPVSNEIRDGAPYEDSEKFAVIERFGRTAAAIRDGREPNPFSMKIRDIIGVDGVRIVFEDNAFLLMRASNTSPKFTYKFEGPTQKRLAAVIEEFLKFLAANPSRDTGTSEIEKELAIQKSLVPSSGGKPKKEEQAFAFRNFDRFIPEREYASFLKGDVFRAHKALVDKNEAADRFGFRSAEGGIFGDKALKERKGIEKWLAARTDEGFRGMVHFGIGGQALGNRAQLEAMGLAPGFRVRVVEKIGTSMADVFSEFRKEGIETDRVLLHASSKSGTTDETLIAFQDGLHALCIELSVHLGFGAVFGEEVFYAFRSYLRRVNRDSSAVFSASELSDLKMDEKGLRLLRELFRRVVLTTTLSVKQSRFYAFACSPLVKELMAGDPLAVFSIPDNVGGRFSELSQSGAVTTLFAGRSAQKQFQAGRKLLPLLESHDPEENTALRLAVCAHLLDPDVIIFAYPLYYMKAEAQQKAQLFPESNGKSGHGAFVITAIGSRELNRKTEQILRLNPKKPPLVIIQNTSSLDSSVTPLELDGALQSRVPCFTFTRANLGEENLAASALFFQEFTVRYGLLYTAGRFISRKISAEKLDFGKKDSPEFKAYSETDPQNQPFVELAKKSVSACASKMFKNDPSAAEEIDAYYRSCEDAVKSGPVVDRIIVGGQNVSFLSDMLYREIREKIEAASRESYSEMEDEVLMKAAETLLALHPSQWTGRSRLRDREDLDGRQKSRQVLEDIRVLGNSPLRGHLEREARKFAETLVYAESQGKIPLPIFYTPSPYAEVLGLLYASLTGYDFGIGTREQHSFFQSILDGLDKTFTILFDFTSRLSLVRQRERQIFTFGMALDYLHNLYPDTVRRLFLEGEADAIATVKRSAAVIRMKGLDDKDSICEAFRFIARGVHLKNAID